MDTNTNVQNQPLELPIVPPDALVGQGSEIDPIRTETIFSRMPLHVLSKSGTRPDINIEKRTPDGKVHEKWEVSYNEKYGPARQLAYDIHTLVIERAIEEAFEDARRAGQPFPHLISIESLNSVAHKIGFSTPKAKTNQIKRALQQNAGILITALKRYRGNDGAEYTIEGVFTPYGIFFFGQKLPDGRRADKVYVNLNDPYFEAWSRGATRPLDYNYKAMLAPIPRRFYELVSYAMYGAIKNSQMTARYRYSEFCKTAPQLRYETFDQIKKQMYKIHRPHVDAGYIIGVKYEQTTDEQGRIDWWMIYTPGPRAYAEFATFIGKKLKPPRAEAGESQMRHSRRTLPRQKRLSLQPTIDPELLGMLIKRGVLEGEAKKLLSNLAVDQPVRDQIEYADAVVAARGAGIENPPGFYVSLLQRNEPVPPTFETTAQRKARQQAEFERRRAAAQQAQLAAEQDEAERQRAEAELDAIAASDPHRYEALHRQAADEFYKRFPRFRTFGNQSSALHEGPIRARMRQLLSEQLLQPAAFADLQSILATPQIAAPGDQQLVHPNAATKSLTPSNLDTE